MENKVVLLNFWPSSYGMRVRIALAEKGIKYEEKDENLVEKSSLLLEMNPVHKSIPVLVHNGKPICESLNILQYIDEVWNENSPLLPSDPYERAQARFWADFIDKKAFGLVRRLWLSKGEKLEAVKKEFIEGLKTLEGELGDKIYFGGDKFGFVDVALAPLASWFYTLETCANFSVEAECPKIGSWTKRCWERESVANSLPNPHKIYADWVVEHKKQFGE
ncbi:hypothetical protein UlMin_012952 [Ulmus minor]